MSRGTGESSGRQLLSSLAKKPSSLQTVNRHIVHQPKLVRRQLTTVEAKSCRVISDPSSNRAVESSSCQPSSHRTFKLSSHAILQAVVPTTAKLVSRRTINLSIMQAVGHRGVSPPSHQLSGRRAFTSMTCGAATKPKHQAIELSHCSAFLIRLTIKP